jgi:DGQHR domain-containing protein
VAALAGNPRWYPVSIEDDVRFSLFRDDDRLNNAFGVLSFDGRQDYYALDGQHRLAAIKALVDPNSDVYGDAPQGFKDEEISVIVVVPSEAETTDAFLRRYRRLFGNLNRYAKPMDQVTNIIMDEDDAFAIITRRLISEHEFFSYSGRQKDSAVVKMIKGKNLRRTDAYFTSLETLYELNITLLSSKMRKNGGWNNDGENLDSFRRFRPEEDLIDSLFDELTLYWNGLINELPVLREVPVKMRDHAAPSGDGTTQDNLLFWPIGQELLAEVARDLLNNRLNNGPPTSASVSFALKGLKGLNWNLHRAPWRNLLLIPDDGDSRSWKIRNEERKDAQTIAKRIVKWQLGLDELAADEIQQLRDDWSRKLLPALDEAAKGALWDEISEAVQR